jgi:hypothetical protein
MATAAQLSKNNQNAQIWTNWGINTEQTFQTCTNDVFETVKQLYPQYKFKHEKVISNHKLLENLVNYSPLLAESAVHNGRSGNSRPDGGVIYVECKDGSWMIVLVGENKHQAANGGNAIERASKNIEFYKNMLIEYDYFPYHLNINGEIAITKQDGSYEYGTHFDRITQAGGFMPVNTVHVKSNPLTPRIRPFTVTVSVDFDYAGVKDTSLKIIAESLDYLKNVNKL